MSTYNDARELVINGLDNLLTEWVCHDASESNETGAEETVRSIHVQSIVYRLMDQV